MFLSGGGCTDNKAGLIGPGLAFRFQYADPAFAVLPLSVKKTQVMPVSGKGGAVLRQTRQGKPLPRLYPIGHGGNVHAGGKGNPGGGGVCFGIRKGKVIIPG